MPFVERGEADAAGHLAAVAAALAADPPEPAVYRASADANEHDPIIAEKVSREI